MTDRMDSSGTARRRGIRRLCAILFSLVPAALPAWVAISVTLSYFKWSPLGYEPCGLQGVAWFLLIYPMLAGVTPQEEIPHVVNTLYRVTDEKYKGHLATGLVGIPVMTEWAVLNGQADFIYRMLKKRDYPGYLYMLDNGATTTWEHWNGDRSRIHNCYNGIGTWFYQALGGLRTDPRQPGYRHVVIDPQIPAGVSWCEITKETPYGGIRLRWERTAAELRIDLTLPPGVSATAPLPEGCVAAFRNGRRCNPEKGPLELQSGRHRIRFTCSPETENDQTTDKTNPRP